LGYQETFLAKEHSKMGHKVYVITSDRYSPILYSGGAVEKVLGPRIRKPGNFIEEGISVIRLPLLFEAPRGLWMRSLEKKILELDPDLIIVHGVVNFAAIRLSLLKRKNEKFKLIIDDHMTFGASRHFLKVLYPIFKILVAPIILQNADALVGVAVTCKQFMNKKYNFPLDKIKVIPLGADTDLFKFDPISREKVRKSLGIADSDIVFVYAGKIIPEKGPHLLVEASLELRNKCKFFKILLIGNGSSEYIKSIQEYVKKYELNSVCIFHDAVPNSELPRYYSASDVAVWPREASLSMFEAMCCELPVIMSDDSEVQERLNYNNGYLFKANQSRDLADKMELLIDPAKRKTLGENGKNFVNKRFSWKIIAKEFIDCV
jgi:glycosyltransferase involved in cell wall biosynthesis